MPEIWLSYGSTDVVLDVKAENLERQIMSGGPNLSDSEIASKLSLLDLSKPTELVITEYSKSVQKILSTLFEICSQKSLPKPKILADKPNLTSVRNMLSDPSMTVYEFDKVEISNTNIVFVGELEFD